MWRMNDTFAYIQGYPLFGTKRERVTQQMALLQFHAHQLLLLVLLVRGKKTESVAI